MNDQPCPRCDGPTGYLATRLPTDKFQLGPQTPDMSRPAVLIECLDQEDCQWAAEVTEPTRAIVIDAAVRRLGLDLAEVNSIADGQARAQARATVEARYLDTVRGGDHAC